jgi:hypothetical protein
VVGDWRSLLPRLGLGSIHSLFAYIRRVATLIQNSNDMAEIQAGLSAMKAQADSFVTTFKAAQAFHVPAAAPVIQSGLDLRAGTPSTAFDALGINASDTAARAALEKELGHPISAHDWLIYKLRGRKFGGGGTVGDVIPALLTPGEHVLQPKAVNWASRMFGGGFLPALNAMQIPRGFLDSMFNLAPPRRPLHFAAGGPVPGPVQSGGGSVKGSAGTVINIHVAHFRTKQPGSGTSSCSSSVRGRSSPAIRYGGTFCGCPSR